MAIKSIWGPNGKIGSIASNGDREEVYDKGGSKLGTSDHSGTRETSGQPVTRQPLSGILFGNKKK